MSATATHDFLARDTAVHQIAQHIADRDAYLVTCPPTTLPILSRALDSLPAWSAYLDNGTGAVLRTDRAGALLVADLLMETAGVLVVPKTVPAVELGQVVGQDIPADGSQDLVVLMPPGGEPIFWPLLFIDALDIVDPTVAAQLRAMAAAAPNTTRP
ncbi:hypothetical protein ABZV24_22370 [Streptomyces sp. NPDC005251]|uniref:hypothetical protein n=1 Tax=Streptomyces sp. NPDC005251 TaxID=3157166 RepID=UPI00339E57E3